MIDIRLAIATDHPAFAGHFPSRPVVPGVVLLDESLRAIGRDRRLSAPLRISAVKFLSVVVPGDPVRLECEASNDTALALRVFAGRPGAERLAMTGVVVFSSRPEGV
jgi:3-hydroxymyristoyl/3-hydroxydecanoyl-(acyl carrier protein) dehydratase